MTGGRADITTVQQHIQRAEWRNEGVRRLGEQARWRNEQARASGWAADRADVTSGRERSGTPAEKMRHGRSKVGGRTGEPGAKAAKPGCPARGVPYRASAPSWTATIRAPKSMKHTHERGRSQSLGVERKQCVGAAHQTCGTGAHPGNGGGEKQV
ncbi:hypothetical protein B0H11DRAFT_2029304 [Mycena galericulata]|nr:hypothetical protein B0H11DRAFT_2029304 [Mycena galericulata]